MAEKSERVEEGAGWGVFSAPPSGTPGLELRLNSLRRGLSRVADDAGVSIVSISRTASVC